MLRLSLERMGHDDLEAEIERGYPLLLEAYGNALDVHTVLYPGVTEALEELLEEGFAIGICTNKPEALAEAANARRQEATLRLQKGYDHSYFFV